MMKNKTTDKIFKVTNQGGGQGEILLYSDIGGFFGIQSIDFINAIKDMGSVSKVDLHVSSEGGSVLDAIDMFNAIRRHPATWTAHIDGIAASSASWLVLATDQVNMAQNAQYMIHRAAAPIYGNANDMRKMADLIENIENTAMVAAYTNKTGMDAQKIIDMMDAETWMDATVAKDYGFVDSVTQTLDMAASVKLSGRYNYTKAPTLLTEETVNNKTKTPNLQAAKSRMFETFNIK